jgi:hypothetical protein
MDDVTHGNPASPAPMPPAPPRAFVRLWRVRRAAAVAVLRLLGRTGRTLATIAATGITFVVLAGPAVLLLGAGAWAGVTYVRTLHALIDLVQQYQIPAALDRLDAVNVSAGVAFLSAGYYAVLFSTMVLVAGLLAHSWRRILLLLGLLLIVPSVLFFGVGALLTRDGITARLALPSLAWVAVTLYALVDAVLLGTVLVDPHPRRRRRPHGRLRSRFRPAAQTTVRPVRYGPAEQTAAPSAPADAALEPDPARLPAPTAAALPPEPARPLTGVAVADTVGTALAEAVDTQADVQEHPPSRTSPGAGTTPAA